MLTTRPSADPDLIARTDVANDLVTQFQASYTLARSHGNDNLARSARKAMHDAMNDRDELEAEVRRQTGANRKKR